jgi:putative intracellular protease/amidase
MGQLGIEKFFRIWCAMRVVVFLISDDEQPVAAVTPAIRLETFLAAYYAFRDAQAEIVLASPAGGHPKFAQVREDRRKSSDIMRRFREDRTARDELTDTLSLDQICTTDFDAALCIGTPGTIFQASTIFQDSATVHDSRAALAASLISELLTAGKPVAIIADAVELQAGAAGAGLLMTGDGAESSLMAAHALLGAIRR